jgi:hypothetical protein
MDVELFCEDIHDSEQTVIAPDRRKSRGDRGYLTGISSSKPLG